MKESKRDDNLIKSAACSIECELTSEGKSSEGLTYPFFHLVSLREINREEHMSNVSTAREVFFQPRRLPWTSRERE